MCTFKIRVLYMRGGQVKYTYITISSPDKVHPPKLPQAEPKLHLRCVRDRALRRCCTLRIALCTSAHSRLSPIKCTIWIFGATWNTGRSSRREELCHFFCRAFCQSFHGQAGSGASWGFWSAVFGGEVAGRRWLAGGWSRLPAVRRAGRSLLVAREDRGASPSYQRPWPPAPGKPCNYNKDISLEIIRSLALGWIGNWWYARSPPGAAFVAVWSWVLLASWCTDTTLQAQPEGAASPRNNQTSRCTHTLHLKQLSAEVDPNIVACRA